MECRPVEDTYPIDVRDECAQVFAPMMAWFLFSTKPNREDYAAENVDRQAYKFLLPRYWDAVERRVAIMFRSYLFVGLNRGRQSIEPILNTYGITGVVRMGENPCPVRPHVIHELQSAMWAQKDRVIRLASPRRHFRFNQRVKITAGPFLDQIARYQYKDFAEQRCFVLLSFFGRETTVPVDEQQLSAA